MDVHVYTITPCTHLRYDRSILYTNFVPCIKKLPETVGKKKKKNKEYAVFAMCISSELSPGLEL